MLNIKELADFIENKWLSSSGLVVAQVFSLTSVFALLISKYEIVKVLMLDGMLGLLIYALWSYGRRIKKTKTGKIGFLVAISCSDSSERQKIQEDFITPLRTLMQSGSNGDSFDFIQASEHASSQIYSLQDADFIRAKARAHFMIYGRVRLREINKEMTHVIHLESIVTHGEVPQIIATNFSKEFSEVMPRRVSVSVQDDVMALEVTSEWAGLAARYIIATAAGITGDFVYSETLYQELKKQLYGMEKRSPIYGILKDKIPTKLSEIAYAKAQLLFEIWRNNKEFSDAIEKCNEYLFQLLPVHQERDDVLTLRAITTFVVDGDAKKAITLLKKVSRHSRQQNWHLNMAFLLGFDGAMQNSARHYRLAEQELTDGVTLGQIEEFIDWAIEKYPNLPQMQYCLAYFNWKVKYDIDMAKIDFENFLKSKPNVEKFYKEIEISNKFLSELIHNDISN